MNDQDYIRKAVELANGWGNLPGHWFSSPRDAQRAHHEIEQWELDALASQLVRQVDALDNYNAYQEPKTTHIWEELSDGECECWSVDGDDRTMNTIKAIVDSGVLVPEGRGPK